MNIQNDLYMEISDQFEAMRNYEKDTEQYKTVVDSTCKLLDRAIEMNKFDAEIEEKDKKAKDEFISDCIGHGLKALEIAGYIGLAVWGTLSTFTFEKTGIVGSPMGRNWINKLIHK